MKICVVSLHAYPIVDADAAGIFGGTETRAVTIARGLSQFTDHDVSFLARHPLLSQPTVIDDVRWIPWRDFWTELRHDVAMRLNISSRWPLVRIKKWSWKLLGAIPLLVCTLPWHRPGKDPRKQVPIFDQLEADLFLIFGVHSVSAQVLFNAQRLQKKTILFLGANNDLDDRYKADSNYITPYHEKGSIAWWVLQQADAVVTQNQFQQQKFQDRFSQPALQLNNPLDLMQWQSQCKRDLSRYQIPFHNYLLWIGRADNFHKRAPLCLEIANALPQIPIVMVMNSRDPIVEQEIHQHLPENVHIIPQVDFSDIPALFEQAIAFLNTSAAEYEGFPNTFLQASVAGIPIISLEVGTDYLLKHETGWSFSGDLAALVAFLKSRLKNDALEFSERPQLPQEYQLPDVITLLSNFIKQISTI